MYFYPYKRNAAPTRKEKNISRECGSRFNRTGCILYISADKASQILLPATLPGPDLYEVPNAIRISRSGMYMISSSLYCYTPGRAVIAVGIRINGKTALGSGLIRTFTPNAPQAVHHSVLAKLNQGDVIDLAVTSNTPVTLALGPGNAASLIILKASDK